MSTAINTSASERVWDFLSSSLAYPYEPSEVKTLQTHISWVFLTNRFAYKLKKPVQFEFVDFSTAALRRQACLDEVRLNRRLAPDVYLGVLPVTEHRHGSLELAGHGRAVDWVVQMRCLPADKALDHVMCEDRLTSDDANSVASFLAKIYAQWPPQCVDPQDYRQALDHHIRANETALLQALPTETARIRRIHSLQLRYLHIEQSLFDNRVLTGHIVDGHGDLRPEHIYLGQPPAVIDCIEFSDDLRRVDVADELNFLAMECQRLGHSGLGDLVLSTYEKARGERIPPRLSSFYRSYRACVRAKVALLQVQQHADDRRQSQGRLLRQYLNWADHYAGELGRPCLLVVYGLMGTGKSTLANRLAESFDIDVLSTDRRRRSTLGASQSPANYGEGLYRLEARRQVYDELLRQASALLDKGQSVILDGAFLTRGLRQRAHDLAHQHGAVPLDVLCECPRETALHRIEQRAAIGGNESEARADLYDLQAREFELPSADAPTIRVETTANQPDQLHTVCEALRSRVS